MRRPVRGSKIQALSLQLVREIRDEFVQHPVRSTLFAASTGIVALLAWRSHLARLVIAEGGAVLLSVVAKEVAQRFAPGGQENEVSA
jgi:hypothetical protein